MEVSEEEEEMEEWRLIFTDGRLNRGADDKHVRIKVSITHLTSPSPHPHPLRYISDGVTAG